MKLKIELGICRNIIRGRVLEQDEKLRARGDDITLIKNDEFEIVSDEAPYLLRNILCVRGGWTKDDNRIFTRAFCDDETARNVYKNIVSLVNELNGEIGGAIDVFGNVLHIDEDGEVVTKVAKVAKVKSDDKDQSAKADKGKLKLSLVNTELVKAVAEVRMYGTQKYGDSENWRKVEPKRYVDALYRHLLAYIEGSEVDEESGLSHLSHMACNLSFLLDKEYLKEHENQESHRWITDN